MSVVIIGGHDRMVCQYKKICRQFNCKAKVFTQMSASLGKQIGSPDLVVLFTNTVSHKMVKCALEEGDAIQAAKMRWKRSLEMHVHKAGCFESHFINIKRNSSARAIRKTAHRAYCGCRRYFTH